MARELYQPHDNLFRKVFSDAPEAAGLLRPNLPEWLSTRLDWSTLTLQDRSYVDEELEASQSDLLFEVQWQRATAKRATAKRALAKRGPARRGASRSGCCCTCCSSINRRRTAG